MSGQFALPLAGFLFLLQDLAHQGCGIGLGQETHRHLVGYAIAIGQMLVGMRHPGTLLLPTLSPIASVQALLPRFIFPLSERYWGVPSARRCCARWGGGDPVTRFFLGPVK